jgi:hypothetical protein
MVKDIIEQIEVTAEESHVRSEQHIANLNNLFSLAF